jgi:hypothetical protein
MWVSYVVLFTTCDYVFEGTNDEIYTTFIWSIKKDLLSLYNDRWLCFSITHSPLLLYCCRSCHAVPELAAGLAAGNRTRWHLNWWLTRDGTMGKDMSACGRVVRCGSRGYTTSGSMSWLIMQAKSTCVTSARKYSLLDDIWLNIRKSTTERQVSMRTESVRL